MKQEWKYREVTIPFDSNKLIEDNGITKEQRGSINIPEYIDILGSQGWEMVSVVFDNNSNRTYIFKQERSNRG